MAGEEGGEGASPWADGGSTGRIAELATQPCAFVRLNGVSPEGGVPCGSSAQLTRVRAADRRRRTPAQGPVVEDWRAGPVGTPEWASKRGSEEDGAEPRRGGPALLPPPNSHSEGGGACRRFRCSPRIPTRVRSPPTSRRPSEGTSRTVPPEAPTPAGFGPGSGSR